MTRRAFSGQVDIGHAAPAKHRLHRGREIEEDPSPAPLHDGSCRGAVGDGFGDVLADLVVAGADRRADGGDGSAANPIQDPVDDAGGQPAPPGVDHGDGPPQATTTGTQSATRTATGVRGRVPMSASVPGMADRSSWNPASPRSRSTQAAPPPWTCSPWAKASISRAVASRSRLVRTRAAVSPVRNPRFRLSNGDGLTPPVRSVNAARTPRRSSEGDTSATMSRPRRRRSMV